jgi:exodeoxyribonuclease VII small subunit
LRFTGDLQISADLVVSMPSEKSPAKTKGAATSKSASDTVTGPSFEEALDSLEDLVAKMEGDELPLEEMIVGYEKGVRLRGICEQRLEEAQAKVELIRDRGVDDVPVELQEFDPAEAGAVDSGSTTEKPKSVNEGADGELF